MALLARLVVDEGTVEVSAMVDAPAAVDEGAVADSAAVEASSRTVD